MSITDQVIQYFSILVKKHFSQEFGSELEEKLSEKFKTRFNDLYTQNMELMGDELSKFHGINPVFVMTMEDTLKDQNIPFEELKKHILTIYEVLLKDAIAQQLSELESSKDPWNSFIEATRTGNKRQYENDLFQLKETICTENEFGFDIKRCYYFEFLKENKREELGSILCAVDYIQAIAMREWVEFTRTETIVNGFPSCNFRFLSLIEDEYQEEFPKQAKAVFEFINNSNEPVSKSDLLNLKIPLDTIGDIVKFINYIQDQPKIVFKDIRKKISRSSPEEEGRALQSSSEEEEEEEEIYGTSQSFHYEEIFELVKDQNLSSSERIKAIKELPQSLSKEKVLIIANMINNLEEKKTYFKWFCLKYIQQYNSISEIARIIEDIMSNRRLHYSIRELSLRLMTAKKGPKLILELFDLAEDPTEDPFLRGRAIDTIAMFTSKLPNLISSSNLEEFHSLPIPVQRSVIDFVARANIRNDILMEAALNSPNLEIRNIALRNLGTLGDRKAVELLRGIALDFIENEFLRQTAIEALANQEEPLDLFDSVLEILTRSEETTFIRTEALQTLRELIVKPEFKHKEKTLVGIDPSPDNWILKIGLEELQSR